MRPCPAAESTSNFIKYVCGGDGWVHRQNGLCSKGPELTAPEDKKKIPTIWLPTNWLTMYLALYNSAPDNIGLRQKKAHDNMATDHLALKTGFEY